MMLRSTTASFLLLLIVLNNCMLTQSLVRSFLMLPSKTTRTKRTIFVRHGILSMASAMSSQPTSTSLLEVEQKFALDDRNLEDIKSRLKQAGFELDSSKEMIDWYFDVEGSILSRQDYWLRYRQTQLPSGPDTGQTNTGQWELKRGQPAMIKNKDEADDTASTLTVYEEIEGADAVTTACSLLSALNFSPKSTTPNTNTIQAYTTSDFRGHPVPRLDVPDSGLEPFARIVTQRSSWRSTSTDNVSPWENLSVDLDTTDFGYAVGEVERVVHRQEDVKAARTHVQALIAEIICNNGVSSVSDVPAVGKLEYFLKRNRPDIYQACVESGTIRL
jgi:thiamine-triphosphatase